MQFLPFLILLYAAVSVGILWAHQATRLFPLYLLKTAWVGFTLLAFAWVVAMSGGQSKEYIQHPAGPLEIFAGRVVETIGPDGKTTGRLQGGYAGTLEKYTGTQPFWIVALLFTAWATWGLSRGGRGQRQDPSIHSAGADESHRADAAGQVEPPGPNGRQWPTTAVIFGAVATVAFAGPIFLHVGPRDGICLAVGDLSWLALAFLAPEFFRRRGGWLLLGLLALAAIPLIEPVCQFPWSRYRYFAENYAYAWNDAHVGEYFVNSLIVTITTVAMTTLFGAMAAYAIARRDFNGKHILYGAVIASIAIPGILIQVPLFLLIKDWGFVVQGYRYSFMDSRLGLAVIYTALSMPFTIFVLVGFFRTLPGSLGEAACIDGCGRWRTFTQVYLPLAMPGIATTGIFNFLGAWNEFNLGMIFMSNPNFKTLPIGLYELQTASQYASAWAPMFAGIVLLCLPTFLIFLVLQERIVAGLTAGGLKG